MGNYFRHRQAAYSLASGAAITTSANGPTYQIIPKADDVADVDQQFQFALENTASGVSTGSATPTLQTSWDGVKWYNVVSGTVVNADGSTQEHKQTPAGAVLGNYVRVVITITGTISFYGSWYLTSNGRFTLRAV